MIKTKKKKTDSKKLIDKLDDIFSIYIRKKDRNEFGLCKCYTCDKEAPWKEMQNGHYIPRSHKATRWLEKNCKVQCVGCNIFKKGNYTEYALRLTRELGAEILEELEREKHKEVHYGVIDLQMMIDEYTEKVKQLEDDWNRRYINI